MAEVLVRQEPSTALPRKPVLSAGSACTSVARRTRGASDGVAWEKGTLLDVLIDNRPALVQLAHDLIGCASLAEDVVHDVFIKLVDFRQQDAVRQPVAYVTRMVHNAAIDVCRRQSQEGCDEPTCCAEENELHAPSPEDAILARDALRQVFNALEQLPPRSRTAFEMVRVREETLEHTARALDVSQTQVHFMVRDAERHCVDCLDASNRGVTGPEYCGGRVRRR
ncbi:RNA polymerase sigma-70 factor, ECF subfamily [Paraburkholderia fungorum]|uniref:RNA polymerase sigma-70 factor, ECF subfamily n=1 Tax=Paraburkholderia fungorum TaxID=134537 RepID=A0A1H1IRS7_9BURK|nr:RNA polymerase factor sigma-70 [Paraburkholderia fungorum]SDR40435.1 RNA polymerase sigma-70 factor, ECF subfamily [Paraburkholderia fungorum]